MKPYRKYDWPALFLAFEHSDLNQTQFCLEQSLNPKYFYQKRKAALRESNASFTKVMVQPQSDLSTTPDHPGKHSGFRSGDVIFTALIKHQLHLLQRWLNSSHDYVARGC
jgi:hypothetical protein